MLANSAKIATFQLDRGERSHAGHFSNPAAAAKRVAEHARHGLAIPCAGFATAPSIEHVVPQISRIARMDDRDGALLGLAAVSDVSC